MIRICCIGKKQSNQRLFLPIHIYDSTQQRLSRHLSNHPYTTTFAKEILNWQKILSLRFSFGIYSNYTNSYYSGNKQWYIWIGAYCVQMSSKLETKQDTRIREIERVQGVFLGLINISGLYRILCYLARFNDIYFDFVYTLHVYRR